MVNTHTQRAIAWLRAHSAEVTLAVLGVSAGLLVPLRGDGPVGRLDERPAEPMAGTEEVVRAAPMATWDLTAPPTRSSAAAAASLRRTIVAEGETDVQTHGAAPAAAEASASAAASGSSEAEELRPAAPAEEAFPEFGTARMPVWRVPNWGAMRTPAEWERTYAEMETEDFVPLPPYDMAVLTTPLESLTNPITEDTIPLITAKLAYSTRFFGAYDLDSREFTDLHPGIDIKLAEGTPLGAIGGGRVHRVERTARLGLHVILEHRVDGETFFSIYGHLGSAWVEEGDDVAAGDSVGAVGMTGNTVSPHVHLQIDRDTGDRPHTPYYPSDAPSAAEADRWTVHPLTFIQTHN